MLCVNKICDYCFITKVGNCSLVLSNKILTSIIFTEYQLKLESTLLCTSISLNFQTFLVLLCYSTPNKELCLTDSIWFESVNFLSFKRELSKSFIMRIYFHLTSYSGKDVHVPGFLLMGMFTTCFCYNTCNCYFAKREI